MTTIKCQDKPIRDTDLPLFGNELNANHARLVTPVNSMGPGTSNVTGASWLYLLDPVIEFDETKVAKAAIEAIMRKYAFVERP